MTAFTPTFLYLTGGFVIWAIRFLAVYCFTALACARGWAGSSAGLDIVEAVVVVLSTAALAGCAAILFRAVVALRREPPASEGNSRFIHHLAAGVAALGALAILWEALPFFLVPVCG